MAEQQKPDIEKTFINPLRNKGYQHQLPEEWSSAEFCFLLDVTGSMAPYISMVKEALFSIIEWLDKFFGKDRTKIAFICYRDKSDGNKQYEEIQDFQLYDKDGWKSSKAFKLLDSVECDGGGDTPEDLEGAIQKSFDLSWKSKLKFLFILTDAPCHGKEYHDCKKDDYPDASLELILARMHAKEFFMVFLEIDNDTNKMVDHFQKSFQEHSNAMKFQRINFKEKIKKNEKLTYEEIKACTHEMIDQITGTIGQKALHQWNITLKLNKKQN